MEFSKQYNPENFEDKWYKFWEDKGLFSPSESKGKKPYSIVIPPPNITGILHMGHALNNTIQDILTRFNRMRGLNTLWLPGTDHAGIATQNVVEKKLQKKGIKREDLGRGKFLEEVWDWKEEYGNTIIRQLKKLGCSCDWSRSRFTMDKGISKAVEEVFIKLYEDGLIYRGNYIINWCPRCHTALAEEEVEHEEKEGKLYYIKYPILAHSSKLMAHSKNKKQELSAKSKELNYIIVATTRPETMLGDTGVAVNPKDERYKGLMDKKVTLPILNRELEVIEDNIVDPEFGTGIVKVTPAHDDNDFQMGKNHGLDTICIFNPDATMNENAGPYEGMDRLKCRKKLVEDLDSKGLIEKIEKHIHQVGHCYRCDTAIEPLISKQWFVKMRPLAKPAIEVVKKKEIEFYPQRWKKVYLNWMENIRDWCISRQIWWGHRLPVYYCRNCHGEEKKSIIGSAEENEDKNEKGVIVSRERPKKCFYCGATDIYQDKDVLDTWFSSWLWPFSTMSWPEETEDLKYFYPTNTLVTAQEIIFFWVARMIMAGLEFMDEVPFEDVYIHGTVRDDTGTKMSKSLGNVIDPIDIIEEFGADALRFSIISITAMGQDVFLSTEKFHLGRNFTNKIWNATRLIFLNTEGEEISEYSVEELKSSDKDSYLTNLWILDRLNSCIKKVTRSLEEYEFNQAADEIYHFFWHTFCDWYLEFIKTILNDSRRTNKEKILTRKTTLKVLVESIKLLHPFMPFITEEIYQRVKKLEGIEVIFPNLKDSIMIEKWPQIEAEYSSTELFEEFEFMFNFISTIRNVKSELNIPLNKETDVYVSCPNREKKGTLNKYSNFIKDISNIKDFKIEDSVEKPEHSITGVVEDLQLFILLEGVVDLEKEKTRIEKKLKDLEGHLNDSNNKLDNQQFLEKAPKEVVEKEKEKNKKLTQEKERLVKNLKDIS